MLEKSHSRVKHRGLPKVAKTGYGVTVMTVAPQMRDLPFGHRLRIARMQAGLSISALASAIGVARETLSAWENGHQEPKASALRAIAEKTGASVDWLLFGDTRVKLKGRAAKLLVHDGSAKGPKVGPRQLPIAVAR
jgi:DNA-binding XRE family transcriptional regulator